MKPFGWHLPTEIVFGSGRIAELGACVRPWGKKPFVVTGRHSAKRSGALDQTLEQLPEAVFFEEVEENPSTATCEAGAARCREKACDVVVGIGGGSPMDAAKAIALLACNPGSCTDYFGKERYLTQPLPVIEVPTTAGTGAEVTPNAVITGSGGGEPFKRSIAGRGLFPAVALIDPDLTGSLPPDFTAYTGLDALSQVMESIVSLRATPMTDALALEAIRVVRRWLPVAVADGQNGEARGWMAYAALLSGCTIAQTGTTLVHGLGYLLTLHAGAPHGLANALLLTPIFQENAVHLPEKVALIAEALGEPCASEAGAAAAAIGKALHRFALDLGVSLAAREWGVREAQLDFFAAAIHEDTARFKNQAGEWTVPKLRRLLQNAYDGPVYA